MAARFSDRQPRMVAVVSLAVLVVVTALALNLPRLPLVNSAHTYSAMFANTGGLATGDVVAVDGVRVGTVQSMTLDHAMVKVTFTATSSLHLGDETTAAAKVQSPLGTEFLALTPAGSEPLRGPIPESDTSVPYTLVGDLYQLTQQVQGYNIPALVKALNTSSDTFSGTPASEAAAALSGLARFSSVLAANRNQLAQITTQGSQLTSILAQRSGQLVDLVGQGNLVLQVLQERQAAIKQLFDSTTALSQQLTTLFGSNQAQFSSLLSNLSSVSAVLAKDSGDISEAMPVLAAFSRYAANITGSGPFADVSIPTLLLPDNLIEECGQAGAFPSANSLVGCRP